MESTQQQLIIKYADPFLRRKKFIIACLLAAIIVGVAYYLRIPKQYQATCLIMYQQQKINPTRLSPDSPKRLNEMVNTVSQQVTSRGSLEGLIKKFDLYPSLRQKLPMEDVVEYMRAKNITILAQRGDIFSVSFQGKDPKKVMTITNELAAKFIEENLRFREERVSETKAYVQDELDMAKEALDQKEATMRDYKLQYYNEMPHQLQINVGRLNALQEQYQNNQTNLQNLENTRLLVLEQIAFRKDVLAKTKTAAKMLSQQEKARTGTDGISDIYQAQKALEELQIRYTDEHPDIKRLKKLIKKMEEDEGGEQSAQDQSLAQGDNTAKKKKVVTPADFQLEKLNVQLKEIEFDIDTLKAEKTKILSQIAKYQAWVDAAPVREAEWSALTRDHNQLKTHYENLVSQNIAAESAETLERRQKGSQFKIVDPAHFPEKPFKPDFKKIMLLAALLGLGFGGAISFAIDFFDASFKSAKDLESFIGMPVTIAIPIIRTEQERRKTRIISISWTIALICTFIIVGTGITYLFAKGLIII